MQARQSLAISMLLAALLGSAATGAGSEGESDLEALRDAIRGSRERVAVYEREQRGLLETVEALDRAIAALRREVAAVRGVADRARQTLDRVESEMAEIRKRRTELERAMAGPAGPLHSTRPDRWVRCNCFSPQKVSGICFRGCIR